ncbi:hypothetical protein [Engelhardtia mirabilis]|uniref:Uncharacterized protein n=1 Tax=Engelhardtia mirabilis TaxID=2528011 RepID=A0A518BQC9_9BACT|nr:hypothetical protein Pla133_43000 [Planctomycetes bacterium Pla133]QDV03510.1 hypothetical protein Pla86_42990 [Planctomycetes bacterium Pla86]
MRKLIVVVVVLAIGLLLVDLPRVGDPGGAARRIAEQDGVDDSNGGLTSPDSYAADGGNDRALAPSGPLADGASDELRLSTIQFEDSRDGVLLDGWGELCLLTSGGALRRVEVREGSARLPDGLGLDEACWVVDLRLDGVDYTYLELDATWAELVEQTPVAVFPGRAVPARVVDEAGAPWTLPLRLGPPIDGGFGVGAEGHARLRAEVTSPIALPFAGPGERLELLTEGGRARFVVPPPPAPLEVDPPDGSIVAIELSDVVLTATRDVELVLLAGAPLDGLFLSVSAVRGLRPSDAEAAGVAVVRLERSRWFENSQGDFELRTALPQLPSGTYRLSDSGVNAEAGVELSVESFEVSSDSEREIAVWIYTDEVARPTTGRIALRFARPWREVLALGEGRLKVFLTAGSGGQLASGQRRSLSCRLDSGRVTARDDFTVELHEFVDLAAGPYVLSLQPVGFVTDVELPPSGSGPTVVVPAIGRVRVQPRGAEAEATAAGGSRPRPVLEPLAVPPEIPSPIRPIGTDERSSEYLLVHGEYGLQVPGGTVVIEPSSFSVDRQEVLVEWEQRRSFAREVRWKLDGVDLSLPLSMQGDVRLLLDGTSVDGVVAQGIGFDLGTQRLAGWRVIAPISGTFVLDVPLTLPDGRTVHRRLPDFTLGEVELPPVIDELSDMDL